jgi:hypothetical protein
MVAAFNSHRHCCAAAKYVVVAHSLCLQSMLWSSEQHCSVGHFHSISFFAYFESVLYTIDTMQEPIMGKGLIPADPETWKVLQTLYTSTH